MPYFSENPEDLAFEKLMRRVPNFEPDPPEADVIQRTLDRQKWNETLRSQRLKKAARSHYKQGR